MANENGEWIMHGLDWNRPYRMLKFKGLKNNKRVGLAIYEPYGGFGNLKSLQVEGQAEIIEPFTDEYMKLLEYKKIPVDAQSPRHSG